MNEDDYSTIRRKIKEYEDRIKILKSKLPENRR